MNKVDFTDKDYYGLLGVGSTASEQEIKDSYRGLVFKFHPDRTNGDERLEDKFKEVAEAYEVLTEQRNDYDSFLKSGVQPVQEKKTNVNVDDLAEKIFEDLFEQAFEQVFGRVFGQQKKEKDEDYDPNYYEWYGNRWFKRHEKVFRKEREEVEKEAYERYSYNKQKAEMLYKAGFEHFAEYNYTKLKEFTIYEDIQRQAWEEFEKKTEALERIYKSGKAPIPGFLGKIWENIKFYCYE